MNCILRQTLSDRKRRTGQFSLVFDTMSWLPTQPVDHFRPYPNEPTLDPRALHCSPATPVHVNLDMLTSLS